MASLSSRGCLLLALGAVVRATGVGAGIEWWGIRYARSVIAGFQHADMALAEVVGNLHDNVLQLRRYKKDLFINVGSAQERDSYRAQWDEVFLVKRYDLMRIRAPARQSASADPQQFVDSVAVFRAAFMRTYDQIRAGSVVTAQQANERMGEAKEAVHQAEQQLVELERQTQLRMAGLADPVTTAGWTGLIANLALLVMIDVPLAWTAWQRPAVASPLSSR
ncbi:MAG TPA: hypothetical protein VMT92_05650 [Steroidobacteraceae bacterium]|nr:hypothetical protein [Steroidobacteraceae bacterium]